MQELANTTRTAAKKVGKWFIQKGQAIRNTTVNWYRKVKAEWEDCSCCILNKTTEVLNRIESHAKEAWERVKARLIEFENRLRSHIIDFVNKGQEAADRAKAWLDKLLPCFCTREYTPVCVEAEGKPATMLNLCYAKCGHFDVVKVGPCAEHEELKF